MKNLLLALDLDHSDQLLLEPAISLAQKYQAKIWIVHIAAPDPDFVGTDVGPTYIRESRANELREEHRNLQALMAQVQSLSIEVEALLVQGPTVEMLEFEIKKLEIDLLILGSHQHGFLYNTFVGHTSIKLLKNQLVPILIIPIPDES